MTDIVERLYGERCPNHDPECCVCVVWDMHDRIEAQADEITHLRDAPKIARDRISELEMALVQHNCGTLKCLCYECCRRLFPEPDEQKQMTDIVEAVARGISSLHGDPDILMANGLRRWQYSVKAAQAAIDAVNEHQADEIIRLRDALKIARDVVTLIRSEIFDILRRHDVSEQCFAEVAMVTHKAIRALKEQTNEPT